MRYRQDGSGSVGESHDGGMSRKSFLRTAAGAAVGGGVLLGGAGAVQAMAGSERAGRQPGAGAGTAADLKVSMVKDLTGPAQTGSTFGMAATDLGIPVRLPGGGQTLYVFGDTWEDRPQGNDWRAPVALLSRTTDLNRGVEWSGAIGGRRARQLWEYQHPNPEFDTVLPSDVIVIGDTMYLHVAVLKPYPEVLWTEIWSSKDGDNWQKTEARWGKGGERLDRRFQMFTWAQGEDGWVYVYSTEFRHESPSIVLHRVRPDQLTRPIAYQPWCHRDGNWSWGRWGDEAGAIRTGQFGELCLRPLAGKWLLTCANKEVPGIEGYVLDSPTSDLNTAPRQTLIQNVPWDQNDPENGRVSQAYGGYVIPGSHLNDLHLTVSQWENPDNKVPGWHYHVMQYRVQGLGA